MKNKNIELDVDFIGGQGNLTKAEEIAISKYIKAQRTKKIRKQASTKPRGNVNSDKKALA